MQLPIETERRIIREILDTDLEGMYELDSDPDVHRYLGNRPFTRREQAMETIQFIRRQYADHGIGRWAVVYKPTNEFIGWTGLKMVTTEINGHVNFYDLGYRFIKRFWGRGIATETAILSLQYAFDQLQASEVYAMADCQNTGSNKVLQKAGLEFIETFELHGSPHNWYRIERTDYIKSRLR